MAVETIPQQWVFSCDCCKAETRKSHPESPPEWIGINISQRAVDMRGNACADASVNLLLCRECGTKATSAMNDAFNSIRAEATP